jgi:hypothetical protein
LVKSRKTCNTNVITQEKPLHAIISKARTLSKFSLFLAGSHFDETKIFKVLMPSGK